MRSAPPIEPSALVFELQREAGPQRKPWEWAVARLADAGVDEARREALALYAAALGTTTGQAWLNAGAMGPTENQRFREWVERRASGEPLAYVVGRMSFRHLELSVNSRVLIPRPETEGLVDRVLAWGAEKGRAWGRALDLGTGSGCVALALATEGRFTSVVATDVDVCALSVATSNVASIAPDTVELRHGTWFEPVCGESFDAIVSNPPYIAEGEYVRLSPAVRDYEPRVALVPGGEGSEAIAYLLQHADRYLQPGGILALEVDATRAHQACELARSRGWASARIDRDIFDRPRYLIANKDA